MLQHLAFHEWQGGSRCAITTSGHFHGTSHETAMKKNVETMQHRSDSAVLRPFQYSSQNLLTRSSHRWSSSNKFRQG